nr:hypothetical protein [Tanacetum cinerariifolium]
LIKVVSVRLEESSRAKVRDEGLPLRVLNPPRSEPHPDIKKLCVEKQAHCKDDCPLGVASNIMRDDMHIGVCWYAKTNSVYLKTRSS